MSTYIESLAKPQPTVVGRAKVLSESRLRPSRLIMPGIMVGVSHPLF